MQGKRPSPPRRQAGHAGPQAPRFASNVGNRVVGKADAGKSLQDFLSGWLGVSRRAAKAVIDGRSVWVNRRCVWIAHHSLKTGDSVEIPRAVMAAVRRQAGSVRRPIAPAERQHVRVLAEFGDFLVVDKPAGIVSCDEPRSVEAILREQLGDPNLQAVHRLDRDTTGCLLFARSSDAWQAAVEVFKTHRVQKQYRAIVVGRFAHPHVTVDTPIDNQPAVSHVTREAVGEDASFLRIRIDTGRTNQIRRHLSSIRYPVVGDRLFGLKSARDPRLMAVPRQMLHAASIELPHPTAKGETIKAHSPLPADFRAALKLFGMGKR